MSDYDNEDTLVATAPAVAIPLDEQPPEEGAVLPPPASAPAVSENPTPDAATEPAKDGTRAAPSDLEGDLRKVLDDYVSGVFQLPEGTLPTPHTLAAEIAKRRGDGRAVSSGAVSDALKRWVAIGFATLAEKPTRFVDYTDAARTEGLTALKAKHRAAKSQARKAAAPPAEPAPAATAPASPAPEAAPASPSSESVAPSEPEQVPEQVTAQPEPVPTEPVQPSVEEPTPAPTNDAPPF